MWLRHMLTVNQSLIYNIDVVRQVIIIGFNFLQNLA